MSKKTRKTTRGRTTARDLIERLAQDPEYQKAVAQNRERIEQRVARERMAQAPLLEELGAVGIQVESAWELVIRSAPYPHPEALPILLEHLSRPYPSSVREGIARALAVPEARFAWNDLVRLFQQETEKDAKDGLAVAISNIANDNDILLGELIQLAKNAKMGLAVSFY